MRQFTVQEGLMGFAVIIGCQTCFFSTKEELAAEVSKYILDPEVTESKYYTPKPCRDDAPTTAPEPTAFNGMGAGAQEGYPQRLLFNTLARR